MEVTASKVNLFEVGDLGNPDGGEAHPLEEIPTDLEARYRTLDTEQTKMGTSQA